MKILPAVGRNCKERQARHILFVVWLGLMSAAGRFFRIFRKLNELYAKVAGYFWMPCPLCGKMFGGHETGGTLWDNGLMHSGSSICWRHDSSYFYRGTEIVEVPKGFVRTITDPLYKIGEDIFTPVKEKNIH